MTRIAVTGAAGFIGSHLVGHLGRNHEVLALRHADLDITDRGAVERFIGDARPSLIINCATVEVDDCERDPGLAEAVHVSGPRHLAEAATRIGAELVHFSTNYVFDGNRDGHFYTIQDEPRPVNAYGKAKIAGEQAVRVACSRSTVIRTSWVFGPGKKTFLCSVHYDLGSGKRVRAVSDIWASTTYVDDLIARVEEILAHGRYGIYHVVNSGVCSYYEFALEAGRLVGLGREACDALVEAVQEGEMKRLAPRPRYTPMRCLLSEKLGLSALRDWRAALASYVRAAPGR